MDEDPAWLIRWAQEAKAGGFRHRALLLRNEAERVMECRGFDVQARCTNLNMIAYLAYKLRCWREMDRASAACLELFQRIPGGSTENLATYQWMRAVSLFSSGDRAGAVDMAGEAVAIFAVNHGETASFVEGRRADLRAMQAGVRTEYLD